MADCGYDETVRAQVLKTDVLGWVKTSKCQRERLFDGFDRSGLHGTKFAAVVGVIIRPLLPRFKNADGQRGLMPRFKLYLNQRL